MARTWYYVGGTLFAVLLPLFLAAFGIVTFADWLRHSVKQARKESEAQR